MSGFSSASLPEAVVKSFLLAGLSILRWLDLPLVCLLLLFTPALWRLAGSAAVGTYTYDIAQTKAQAGMAMARAEGFPFRLTVEEAS